MSTTVTGIIAGALLGAYLVYSGWDARKNPYCAATEGGTIASPERPDDAFCESTVSTHDLPHGDIEVPDMSRRMIALRIIFGIAGLPLGANLVVTGGIDIAETFGVSDAVIGLSLIAVGTSLPELATSVMAVFRRNDDVVVGNIIGSNIMNILAILGVTAIIAPITISPDFLSFHLWVMLGAAVLLLPIAMTGRKVGRGTGIFFLVAYGAYLYAMFAFGHMPPPAV